LLDDTILTPAPDPAPQVTPPSGDDAASGAGTTSEGSSSQEETVPAHRYKGASEEALRQKQRADAAEARLAQTNWMLQQQANQVRQTPTEVATPTINDDAAYADAVLAGDTNTMQQIQQRRDARLLQEFHQQEQVRTSQAADQQAALSVLQEASAPLINNPQYQSEILSTYNRFQADPRQRLRFKPIEVDYPGYGRVDINLMAEAARDVARSHNISAGRALDSFQQYDNSGASVPATSGDMAPPGQEKVKFDARQPERLLTADELASLPKMKKWRGEEYSAKDIWEGLSPEVKAARLERGRPVTAGELGLKGRTFGRKT